MLNAAVREQPDAILHLGDGAGDLAAIKRKFTRIPIMQVKGNCDIYSSEREWCAADIGGKRIFMTHGHIYRVKWGLESVVFAALEHNADILLFGHTHTPIIDSYGDLTIMNPGAAGSGKNPSCGLIEIDGGEIICRILPCALN